MVRFFERSRGGPAQQGTPTRRLSHALYGKILWFFMIASQAIAGPCTQHWTEGIFCLPGPDGPVQASTTWNDGSGDALYLGGNFKTVGCDQIDYAVRWDGSAWQALTGENGGGVSGRILSFAVYDDGTGTALYAGGHFETADGATVNHVAKWDGSNWHPLEGFKGIGVDGQVYALSVFDDGSGPALYVGGRFSEAGGVSANNVAKWDGMDWSPLSWPQGNGVEGFVFALETATSGNHSSLYVGGAFEIAGDTNIQNIANWNGQQWWPLATSDGAGTNGRVTSLKMFDDGYGQALYVGGYFSTAGGIPVNHIARWDDAGWSALTGPSGFGTDQAVWTLQTYDDGNGIALYVSGLMSTAGGVEVDRIAKWDGSIWSDLALSDFDREGNKLISTMSVFDGGDGPSLITGGFFIRIGGFEGVFGAAGWDGKKWSPLIGQDGVGVSRDVNVIKEFDDGTGSGVYVGGRFTHAGVNRVNHIARLEGETWTGLSGSQGTGVNGHVSAMQIFNDGSGEALYVGGGFTEAGGIAAHGIARWDGKEWSALSGPGGNGVAGLYGWVNSLCVYDDGSGPALYVGGSFTTAGGIECNGIAKWDGIEWSALADSHAVGLQNAAYALEVFDDGTGASLFVGGSFQTAGDVKVYNIAKWDGNEWSALEGPEDTGVSSVLYSLQVFDDGSGAALYAGGNFYRAGGIPVWFIARWDGNEWSGLADGPGLQLNGRVHTLEVFDDGTGPALFAGGGFGRAGEQVVSRIAKWDGSTWSPLQSSGEAGVQGTIVNALAAIGNDTESALYVGGRFWNAGGSPSVNLAKWVGCTDTCTGDVNGDGVVDLNDLNMVLTRFGQSVPFGDANGDGTVDMDDLSIVLAAFGQTCTP